MLKLVEETAFPLQKKTSLHLLGEQRKANTLYFCHGKTDSCKATVGQHGKWLSGKILVSASFIQQLPIIPISSGAVIVVKQSYPPICIYIPFWKTPMPANSNRCFGDSMTTATIALYTGWAMWCWVLRKHSLHEGWRTPGPHSHGDSKVWSFNLAATRSSVYTALLSILHHSRHGH